MSLDAKAVQTIVDNISLGYGMKLKLHDRIGDSEGELGWFLQVYAENDPCHDTGVPINWTGRKWFVSTHATESELVLTAWKAFFSALEHEAREDFKYGGIRILDPHISIPQIWQLMRMGQLGQEHRT